MPQESFQPKSPTKAQQVLMEQYHRIKSWKLISQLWDRVLTAQERRKLGNNIEMCYRKLGTVGLWQKLHGGSKTRAVIEVAAKLGLLDATNRRWLLREFAEPARQTIRKNRPRWRRDTGELCYDGKVVRRLRVCAKPTNIELLLNEFEDQGWPAEIGSPLMRGEQQTIEAVRSLNNGLTTIHFYTRKGGMYVTWKRP